MMGRGSFASWRVILNVSLLTRFGPIEGSASLKGIRCKCLIHVHHANDYVGVVFQTFNDERTAETVFLFFCPGLAQSVLSQQKYSSHGFHLVRVFLCPNVDECEGLML